MPVFQAKNYNYYKEKQKKAVKKNLKSESTKIM